MSVPARARQILSVAILLLGAATSMAACATTEPSVQRATEGPTADDVWRARFVRGYQRLPTFDETHAWRDEFLVRIGAYLARDPQLAVSPRASQFRFQRRVAVGMTKADVRIILDEPDVTTTDAAVMQKAAGAFWPAMAATAREMWAYPTGWQLYFDGDRLVDMTVTGHPPLE